MKSLIPNFSILEIAVYSYKTSICVLVTSNTQTTLFDNRCAIVKLLTKAALAGLQAAHAL